MRMHARYCLNGHYMMQLYSTVSWSYVDDWQENGRQDVEAAMMAI